MTEEKFMMINMGDVIDTEKVLTDFCQTALDDCRSKYDDKLNSMGYDACVDDIIHHIFSAEFICNCETKKQADRDVAELKEMRRYILERIDSAIAIKAKAHDMYVEYRTDVDE